MTLNFNSPPSCNNFGKIITHNNTPVDVYTIYLGNQIGASTTNTSTHQPVYYGNHTVEIQINGSCYATVVCKGITYVGTNSITFNVSNSALDPDIVVDVTCSNTINFGNLTVNNNTSTFTGVSVNDLLINCSAPANGTCNRSNLAWGTRSVTVTGNCGINTFSATVNGQNQTGNGALNFTVVTNALTPDINVSLSCI
jgi:hypothetical protein